LAILAHVTWPRAQLLDGCKFSVKTRLESESEDFDLLSIVSGSTVMI